MADGTKAGGDAPRTLFSLGRSGKRKGRASQASPLEDYPPRHAEEAATDVATLDAPDAEVDTAIDAETTEPEVTDEVTDAPEEIDAAEDAASEPCPSCSLPLVPGAMFCGECGTRVSAPEEAAPAAVLLDDAVPGEPLPPEAEGSFEVAEPVTGSFEDDEDLIEDDGAEIEESAVFGAFIAADDETEPEAEAELVEDELVEEETEPESELVEDDLVEEEIETEPEAELVEDELVDEVTEPEAELAEAELVDGDTDDHDGAVVPIVAAAAGAAAVGLASADTAEAEPLESSAASTGAGAGGSGGGSKKGVWIGAAAAAAAVVFIVGVVAMGSGGNKSGAKKNDQVAAGSQKTTTTTAAPSTTGSTATSEAPTTSSDPATTDTSAPTSTQTSIQAATTTAPRVVGPPPPPPPASPANIQVDCPPNLRAGTSNAIVLHNVGGRATSFLITWSALKTGVSVSPTTGSVGANSIASILVNVAPGTPGSGSRVTIKWSGGATSCNLLVV